MIRWSTGESLLRARRKLAAGATKRATEAAKMPAPFVILDRPKSDRMPHSTIETVKYDDAEYYLESSDIPDDLDEMAAHTHIGMFLSFMIFSGFASEQLLEDCADEIEQLRRQEITPGRFVQIQDGGFLNEFLTDEVNAFTEDYYDEKNFHNFTDDYMKTFPKAKENFYAVPDTWESFRKLRPLLDRRLADWTSKPLP